MISFVKDNSYVIDKLQPGLTHFFRVITYNGAGVSLPGPVSDPVTLAMSAARGRLFTLRSDSSLR